jgi:hypothetical protein
VGVSMVLCASAIVHHICVLFPGYVAFLYVWFAVSVWHSVLQVIPACGIANLISAYVVFISYFIMCSCSDVSKFKFGWITF